MKALPRAAAWSIPSLFFGAVLVVQLGTFAGCSTTRMAPERDADAPVTAANSCSTRNERCNSRDDDCDGIIDEDADSTCAIAHAAATCVRGTCVVERCSNGYFNCNNVSSDGCESRRPCGECQADPASCAPADASVVPSMSQQTGTPDRPSAADSGSSAMADAAVSAAPQAPHNDGSAGQSGRAGAVSQAGAGGRAARVERPGHAGAGGARGNEPDADGGIASDAGLSGTSKAHGCAESAPTGQGEACDRCVCESCAQELDNCTGTADNEWNMLCGSVLRCFGKNVQAGLCTGSDSDCYQNGTGPCAGEFRSAFARGFMCTSNPVRTPCGGLTRVRLDCYRTKCAAVCKS